jgi:hypothetical protein
MDWQKISEVPPPKDMRPSEFWSSRERSPLFGFTDGVHCWNGHYWTQVDCDNFWVDEKSFEKLDITHWRYASIPGLPDGFELDAKCWLEGGVARTEFSLKEGEA